MLNIDLLEKVGFPLCRKDSAGLFTQPRESDLSSEKIWISTQKLYREDH